MRKLFLLVTGLSAIVAVDLPIPARLRAQTQAPAADASANPVFEVASVKQNRSGEGFIRVGMAPGGRFTATNVPLRQLILMAYQVQPFQIVGGPSWIASDRFDIVAKAAGDMPPSAPGVVGPMQLMMRTLLGDRFKLTLHNEQKEMPIYTLVLAKADGKLGPQLRQSTTDCASIMRAAAQRGGPPPPPSFSEPMQCGMRVFPGALSAGGFPLSQLAQFLSSTVQRVVVDRTGLTGNFDLNMTWTPDQMPQGRGDPPPGAPPLPAIDPNGPSIFTAVQEQLGLKLESTKGPVDVLVIDRAEHPSED
jgi:bla regulator protein blaR1